MKHIAPQLEFDFSAPAAPQAPAQPRRQSAAKRKDWIVDCAHPGTCPKPWAGGPAASLCHGCRFFANSRGPAFWEPKGVA